MGFSRPEYWSGLPLPSPGDLPDPGIEPRSPALQADSLPSEPPGKPKGTTLTPCPHGHQMSSPGAKSHNRDTHWGALLGGSVTGPSAAIHHLLAERLPMPAHQPRLPAPPSVLLTRQPALFAKLNEK